MTFEMPNVVLPEWAELATVTHLSFDSGAIVVVPPADPGAGPAVPRGRTVATFTDPDIGYQQMAEVLAWSRSHEELLVLGYRPNPAERRSCGALFAVRTDGMAATRLSEEGPATYPDEAGISWGGERVAFVQDGELRVALVGGTVGGAPVGACDSAFGPIQWPQGDGDVLAICDFQLLMANLAGQRTSYAAPPQGQSVVAAAWSAGGTSIVAVTAPDGEPQDTLRIFDVDPVEGTFSSAIEANVTTEWVFGAPVISPYGRWLLIQGDGLVPADVYPTYVVDLATGATAPAPWPILRGSRSEDRIAWVEEDDLAVYSDGGLLYALDLNDLSRTEVGAADIGGVLFARNTP